jgi:hypothetical protein
LRRREHLENANLDLNLDSSLDNGCSEVICTSSLNFIALTQQIVESEVSKLQIPLHITKVTFNSLPGNQTSQVVDLKIPSTHSTLPLSSTSSHFINFIPLHKLYPTPSISSLYQLHTSSYPSSASSRSLNPITLPQGASYHTLE